MFERIDWLEPCDESYIEELDLLAAMDETQKRKGEEKEPSPVKKSKK